MKRAFEFDVLACPKCDGRLQVISTIMSTAAIRAILTACGFPADSPKRAPAQLPTDDYWEAA